MAACAAQIPITAMGGHDERAAKSFPNQHLMGIKMQQTLMAPPRLHGRVRSPATAALIELVRRPDGATPTDAIPVLRRHGLTADLNFGAERLRKLVLAGHAVRHVSPNGRVRYFRDDAAVQAWLARAGSSAPSVATAGGADAEGFSAQWMRLRGLSA